MLENRDKPMCPYCGAEYDFGSDSDDDDDEFKCQSCQSKFR